ncbi:MAG: hypothetical protein LBC84_08250 [Prevotellaceae bacterium]|jgi:hypothetical protein|nr:hypothetical protein [Prevotellaceae bacterium]
MRATGFIFLYLTTLFSSCDKLFPDEKLTLQRRDYVGNELRTDGYYYSHWASYNSLFDNNTAIMFFYRNGVVLNALSYDGINLERIENEMVLYYDIIQKYKSGWGVFIIDKDIIMCEQWSTSAGGGLPVYRRNGRIENETTFTFNNIHETWHFKQFSPKPDSTNSFIK